MNSTPRIGLRLAVAVFIQAHDRYSSYLGLKTQTVEQYWYCKNIGGELECNKTCDKSPHCREV